MIRDISTVLGWETNFPRAEVYYFPDWQGGGVDIYSWQNQWETFARNYGHPDTGYVESAADLQAWLYIVQRAAQAQIEREGLPAHMIGNINLAQVAKEWHDAHGSVDPYAEAQRQLYAANANALPGTVRSTDTLIVDRNVDPLIEDLHFITDVPVGSTMEQVEAVIQEPVTAYELESGYVSAPGGGSDSLLERTQVGGAGGAGGGGGVEISTGTFLGVVLIGVAVWYAHRQGWF